MSLKNIKQKIRSVDKTHQVTKAMEAVSAVKMRKSQERALLSRPYARAALTILSRVSGSVDVINHPLTQKREGKRLTLLVVTSDKGLAGSLNSAVLKEVRRLTHDRDSRDISALCIGAKGFDFCTKRGFTVLKHYDNIGDDVSVHDMREVTNHLSGLYQAGETDACAVVYSNFLSTFEQEAVSRQILPLSFSAIREIIEGIVPEKGKYHETHDAQTSPVYTIEPSPEDVLEELLPALLSIELYHVLLEAKASEHSARMVAMKNASDKAEDMTKELTLAFNKARQSLITREMSEIIGGMEALS